MTLCNRRRSVITKEEINTAYFRLVVQYTPELNPEKIHLIRNAYETLTDPKARLNYDAQLASNSEVKQLCDEGHRAMMDQDWVGAINSFKRSSGECSKS
ncbi:MAG TPA: DnaJ domain-containing protein [Bacillota bacterium]|jgi:curved DNA-binding protein CbpA|nr:DnaJ domain-containing protein [Bacillota bacterium]HPQ11256.1 DnaJ domain-containing protein [Bacillota bacterium]HQD79180.1 DnaJ domain-containing protein [Bacillota bacterium]